MPDIKYRISEMKPSILFHRATQWRGKLRGSTNVIAECFLSAGYPVTWLTRPINIFHLLFNSKSYGVDLYRRKYRKAPDGATVISPLTLLPRPRLKFFGSYAWMLQACLAYRSIYPPLGGTLEAAGQPGIDVIWTCGGDGGALRHQFPDAKRIVQCVDIIEGYAGKVNNRLEMLDYKDADAVVTIGHALAEFLVRSRGVDPAKLTVIGQGVDLDAYQAPIDEPEKLKPLPRPRMIWLGLLNKADPALMSAALEGLPEKKGALVLIGPPATWVDKLCESDRRVHFFGPKAPNEAIGYLKWCDIGLMLYRKTANPLIYLGQNPLKLYEYAAAGLPIISTAHEEYRYLKPPVLEANTPHEVEECVGACLASSDVLSKKALSFAKAHTWKKRFEEAERLILNLMAS